jgi:rhodanese-related sulfurtransferase
MVLSVKQLMSDANAAVPKISVDEARKLVTKEDALLVDVRDGTELAKTGKLKGATHVSRGTIEFRADTEIPSHDPQFRKDRPIVLYCASGGRSALAGKVLKDMGYTKVHNLGGFKDAADRGFETEPA